MGNQLIRQLASAEADSCFGSCLDAPDDKSSLQNDVDRKTVEDSQVLDASPTEADLLAKKDLLELWDQLFLNQTPCTSSPLPTPSDAKDFGRLLGDYSDLHSHGDKTVSAQGAVCLTRIEWNDSKYTGLFKRADYGLLRCSSALPTKLDAPGCPMMSNMPGTLGKSVVMPFVALKVFRNGRGSGNLLFGGRKTGQTEQDFFANCVCTHTTERSSMALWPVMRVFRQYSAFPCQSGVSDFARTSQSGEEEESPVFPWVITLRPIYQASHSIEGQNFLQQLSNVPAGTALYKVIACANPDDAVAGHQEEIGTIYTASTFIQSSLESKLRFRHQIKEEDYELRPEWKKQLTSAHANYGWEHFSKIVEKAPIGRLSFTKWMWQGDATAYIRSLTRKLTRELTRTLTDSSECPSHRPKTKTLDLDVDAMTASSSGCPYLASMAKRSTKTSDSAAMTASSSSPDASNETRSFSIFRCVCQRRQRRATLATP